MANTFRKYILASVSIASPALGPTAAQSQALARRLCLPCYGKEPLLLHCWDRTEESRRVLEDVLCNI